MPLGSLLRACFIPDRTARHEQRDAASEATTHATAPAHHGLHSCATAGTSRGPEVPVGAQLDLPGIPAPSANPASCSDTGSHGTMPTQRRSARDVQFWSAGPRQSRSRTLPGPAAAEQLPTLTKPLRCISAVDDTPPQHLQWSFGGAVAPAADVAAAPPVELPLAEARGSGLQLLSSAAGSPCDILGLEHAGCSSGGGSGEDSGQDEQAAASWDDEQGADGDKCCGSWLSSMISMARSSGGFDDVGDDLAAAAADADCDISLALPALRVPSLCSSDAFSGVSFAGLMSQASRSGSHCPTRASTFMGCDERTGGGVGGFGSLSTGYYSLADTPMASTAGNSPAWSPNTTGLFAQLRAAANTPGDAGSRSVSHDARCALPSMPASPFARDSYCGKVFDRESRGSVDSLTQGQGCRTSHSAALPATPPTAASHAATLLRRPTSNCGALKSATSAGRSQVLRPCSTLGNYGSPAAVTGVMQRSCSNVSPLSGGATPTRPLVRPGSFGTLVRPGSGGALLSRHGSGMSMRRSVPLHFLSIQESSRRQEERSPTEAVPQALRPLCCKGQDGVQLLQCIDSGSQGAVYQGIWRDSPVAVKISHGGSLRQPLGFARHSEGDTPVQHTLLHEAMIGMSLRHANLVPTYTAQAVPSDEDGFRQPELLIIMEHCKGPNLRSLLDSRTMVRADSPTAASEVLGIAADVCSAVAYMHGSGVVHGDLKAANVMLVPRQADGAPSAAARCYTAKLADFGQSSVADAARLAGACASQRHVHDSAASCDSSAFPAPGEPAEPAMVSAVAAAASPPASGCFTFTHAAPELFHGAAPSYASDVYAFGVLLWELVSQRRPYAQLRTPAEILLRKTLPGSTALDLRFDADALSAASPRPLSSGDAATARPASAPDAGSPGPEWLDAVAQLCRECWANDPEARPTIAEVHRRLRSCIHG